jgi:hypothetical protein
MIAAAAAVAAAAFKPEEEEKETIFKGTVEEILNKLVETNIITDEFKKEIEDILSSTKTDKYEIYLATRQPVIEKVKKEKEKDPYNIDTLALQFDQLRDLPLPELNPVKMNDKMNHEIASIRNTILSLNELNRPNYQATFKSIRADSNYDKFTSIEKDTQITKKYIFSTEFESYHNFIGALENINAITGLGTLDFTDRLAKLDMIDCTCRYDIAKTLNSSLFHDNEFKDIVDFM